MATARVERRLAAILAADVVGYSRLMEQDEAGTFARLKAVRKEVVEPVLARYGGRFVDLKGDGAIVEFQSAVAAVEAAAEIQRAMLDQDPELPEGERIRYRIGINLGEVIVDGDTIYGDGVNVAARIESLCEPCGVWLSRSVYNQVRGKLDLAFAPSGLHQVKNISEAVETFRVALGGVEAPKPAARLERRTAPRLQKLLLPVTIASLTLLIAAGVWRFWPGEPPEGRPGIAVLPFDNYGGDDATGRLADGLTEDTITDLSHFREFDVIARNSTAVYKGKPVDVRRVGQDLHVTYVLEGSIQRQGDRLRVTAQLIDTRTGAHIWSDRWDRPAEDVFAVQTQVAEKVASSLGGYGYNSLAHAGQASAKRKRPGDLTGYDLYLLATERQQRRSDLAEVEEAKRLYDEAVGADPQLARAYVGRAWTHMILTFYGPPYDFTAGIAAMEADARTAIGFDPQEAEAHAVLGEALYNQGRFVESTTEYDTALQLNPSSADIAALAGGILCFMGQPERAAELADRAAHLNPAYPRFYTYYLGPAYYFADRAADAVQILESLPPGQRYEFGWLLLAAAHAVLGHETEAATARAAVLKITPSFSAETGLSTNWRIMREQERQRFIEGVRKAGLPVCAEPAAVTALTAKDRLPECEAERAKAAAVKS